MPNYYDGKAQQVWVQDQATVNVPMTLNTFGAADAVAGFEVSFNTANTSTSVEYADNLNSREQYTTVEDRIMEVSFKTFFPALYTVATMDFLKGWGTLISSGGVTYLVNTASLVIVTSAAHGLLSGDKILSTVSGLEGEYVVTKTGTNTFTFTVPDAAEVTSPTAFTYYPALSQIIPEAVKVSAAKNAAAQGSASFTFTKAGHGLSVNDYIVVCSGDDVISNKTSSTVKVIPAAVYKVTVVSGNDVTILITAIPTGESISGDTGNNKTFKYIKATDGYIERASYYPNNVTVHSEAHGLNAGDWIQFLVSRSWVGFSLSFIEIAKVDANSFKLGNPLQSTPSASASSYPDTFSYRKAKILFTPTTYVRTQEVVTITIPFGMAIVAGDYVCLINTGDSTTYEDSGNIGGTFILSTVVPGVTGFLTATYVDARGDIDSKTISSTATIRLTAPVLNTTNFFVNRLFNAAGALTTFTSERVQVDNLLNSIEGDDLSSIMVSASTPQSPTVQKLYRGFNGNCLVDLEIEIGKKATFKWDFKAIPVEMAEPAQSYPEKRITVRANFGQQKEAIAANIRGLSVNKAQLEPYGNALPLPFEGTRVDLCVQKISAPNLVGLVMERANLTCFNGFNLTYGVSEVTISVLEEEVGNAGYNEVDALYRTSILTGAMLERFFSFAFQWGIVTGVRYYLEFPKLQLADVKNTVISGKKGKDLVFKNSGGFKIIWG